MVRTGPVLMMVPLLPPMNAWTLRWAVYRMNVFETQVESPGPFNRVAPMFLLDPLALYTSAIAPTENAFPVCFAHMVTFTRAVPILVYEPQAVTTLSPEMAGTVKLSPPELVLGEELVARGECVGCWELFGWVEAVAVAAG